MITVGNDRADRGWWEQFNRQPVNQSCNKNEAGALGNRDGNGQGRVRVKYLPVRLHIRLSLLYPYPPNITGKNPYPYPYPQGTRRVKGYPMGININMSLSSYIRIQ
jgi:hypothetical protein